MNPSTGFTPDFLIVRRELKTRADTILAKRFDAVLARTARAEYVRQLHEYLANAIKEANCSGEKSSAGQMAAYD